MKKGITALANDIRNGVLSVLVLFVFCVSCNTTTTKDISGMYVNSSKNEFSIAMDTVVIRHYNNNTYWIERRTGFNRIINGVKQGKKYKKESSFGVLDENSGQLQEQKFGRTYSFTETANELIIGNAFYRKIK